MSELGVFHLQDFNELVFSFRGQRVMIDRDLAALYGTETKKLKQQVRRNMPRFPSDFMFELDKEETQTLLVVPRLSYIKHSSVCPMVFTEMGVAMLSSVLGSPEAVQMNIDIMRAFSHYRALLRERDELWQELRELDDRMDRVFHQIMTRVDELTPKAPPLSTPRPIGFRKKG